jgi:histidinol-phosphatase
MQPDQLREIVDFARAAAQAAGGFTLHYYQRDVPYETKSDNSPVSLADRGAERILRQMIEAQFPDHGILGEEYGEKPGRAPARWILDPIDGTVSFLSGVPLYSVLVGFEWEGEMLGGVIHMPALSETVSAGRGLGCYWNNRAAHVSAVTALRAARVCLTSTKLAVRRGRWPAYERVRDACAVDRGWSDAYAYALLATGRVDVVLDPEMSLWDTAALLPVVTEAGGTLTDWAGRPTHTAPEALATNGALLPQVLERLQAP